MSLVPFTSSTPATGLPPVARAATPGVSARPVAGGPSPLASPRGHTLGRESASSATTGKGRAAFASVLAAAESEIEPIAPESMTMSTRRAAAPDAAQDVARTAPDEGPVIVNDLRMPAASELQTPWLLLALGVTGWSDGLPAMVVVSEDAPAAAAAGADSVEALTTLAVVPGDSALAPVMTAPVLFAPAVVAAVPSALPLASASPSVSLPAEALTGAVGAEPSLPVPVAGEPVAPPQGPVEAATVSVVEALPAAGDEALDPTRRAEVPADPPLTPGDEGHEAAGVPPADLLARWRAASRGTDRARDFVLPGLGGDAEAATSRMLAPGQAVSRLAHALGQAARRADVAVAGAALPVAGQAEPVILTPTASVVPSAHASEVLSRLAQGAGLPGVRKTSDAGASSAVFAQMLSTAMPTPTADAPATAAPAAPLPAATGEHVLAQMVSFLKLQWKDGVGEAKLHLRPDALGPVSVSLKVEGGAVTAVVRAENPQVQEWILQHQPSLRQQMEAAGLRLDDLVVSPDDQRQSQGQQSQEREDLPRPRARRDRDDARVDGERFEMLL